MTGAVDSEERYWRPNDHDENEDDDKSAECGEGGLAATPTPQPCGWANRVGEDRFVVKEAAQFVGEVFRGRVAAGRFLLEAFQANGLQSARDSWIEQPGRNRFGIQDLGH